MKKKKLYWTIFVLLVVAIGVVVWAKYKGGNSLTLFKNPLFKKQQNQLPPPPQAEITQVDHSKLPGEFPKDIPLEKDAKILENNVGTLGDRVQCTRMFVTKKTLAENYSLYKSWLEKNGWKLEASLDQVNLKSLSATKAGKNITITLNNNFLTEESTVSIVYGN